MAKTNGFILMVDEDRFMKDDGKQNYLYSEVEVQNLRKAGLLPLGTVIFHVDSLKLELPPLSEEGKKDIEALEEHVAKIKSIVTMNFLKKKKEVKRSKERR